MCNLGGYIIDHICRISFSISQYFRIKQSIHFVRCKCFVIENLASLLITKIATEFPGKCYEGIYDPMCGCGTFLTEAAVYTGKLREKLATLRPFAFQNWPVYSEGTFNFTARQNILPINSVFSDNLQIYGSDINKENIHLTSENAKNLGLKTIADFTNTEESSAIHLAVKDFFRKIN